MAVEIFSYSANWTGSLLTVGYVLGFIIGVGGLAFFIYRLRIELQYNKLITVQKVMGNNIDWERTVKARVIPKKNQMHLKKFRQWLPIPGSEYWVQSGNTWKCYMQHDGVQMFAPSKAAYNSPLTFTPARYSILEQMGRAVRDAELRHKTQSMWKEYMPQILFLGALGFAIVAIIVVGKMYTEALDKGIVAASMIKDGLQSVGTQVVA